MTSSSKRKRLLRLLAASIVSGVLTPSVIAHAQDTRLAPPSNSVNQPLSAGSTGLVSQAIDPGNETPSQTETHISSAMGSEPWFRTASGRIQTSPQANVYQQQINAAVDQMGKPVVPFHHQTSYRKRNFDLSLRMSLYKMLRQGPSAAPPTTEPATVEPPARHTSDLDLTITDPLFEPSVFLDSPVSGSGESKLLRAMGLLDSSTNEMLDGSSLQKTQAIQWPDNAFVDQIPPSPGGVFEPPVQPQRQNALSDFDLPLSESAQQARTVTTTEGAESPFRTAVQSGGTQQQTEASLASARLDRLAFKHYQSSPIGASIANGHSYYGTDFSPHQVDQQSMYADPQREAWVYDGKFNVPTQRPWIEWPRQFYGPGITPKGWNLWGEKNLYRPEFYLYGDFRTGILFGENDAGKVQNWSNRLNLDFDFWLTDVQRFHMFIGPLDEDGQFTRLERVDGRLDLKGEIDFTPVTGFYEGDLGVTLGNLFDRTSPFELPFTAGLMPLLFQNGIWMEDAVSGFAFALPSRHSRLLNISNMDLTFFAAFDQINSPAFGGDDHAAQAFGTAWFIEAYDGYIEAGYAYLRDRNQDERSYHNATISYTRRYFDRISNSVRVIVNSGQDLPDAQRTADGVLLLYENSLITAAPLTVVPYLNFFVGWDRPQSVARAAGGVIRNTGINFDSDGLNGFPSLDATGSDTAGCSLGIDLIGNQLDKQLVLEASYMTNHGSKNANVQDDQFAIGKRFQMPISHSTLIRTDAMYGWRRGLDDIFGTRFEFRWKF